MFRKIWSFICNIFQRKTPYIFEKHQKEKLYGFKETEGRFPEVLEANILYVLKEDGVPWEAAMICPSGCGDRLELNLLPDERPLWRYSVENGVPTLYPSVNREIGCRAHFFLRNGKIVWAYF